MNHNERRKFEIGIIRHYYTFVDLMNEKDYDAEELGTKHYLLEYENSDEISEAWAGTSDAEAEIRDAGFLVLYSERAIIVFMGSCMKCGFIIEETFMRIMQDQFCTECGEKRNSSTKIEIETLPNSFDRVLKRDSNWEASKLQPNLYRHFKNHGIGCYAAYHSWTSKICVEENSTFENIKSSFVNDSNWERDGYEWSGDGSGMSCLVICPSCKRDFKPLEKFCESCGTKQTWFDDFKLTLVMIEDTDEPELYDSLVFDN